MYCILQLHSSCKWPNKMSAMVFLLHLVCVGLHQWQWEWVGSSRQRDGSTRDAGRNQCISMTERYFRLCTNWYIDRDLPVLNKIMAGVPLME